MKDIQISIQQPLIEFNYQLLKSSLEKDLKQYDVVLTSDDQVADAKKMATSINKQCQEVDRRIKEAICEASEPIRDLEEKRKELYQMHQAVRQRIRAQVAQREEKVRERAQELLTDLRQNLWEEHKVDHGFHRAEFDDLIKISSVTEKGNLTKAAKDELERRVRDDRAAQDRTERRLLELENRSYRAGLEEPLVREHVAHVLWSDDERYENELTKLLDAEVRRQERAKAKAEAKSKAAREAAPAQEPEPAPAPAEEPRLPATRDGKIGCQVTATFNIRIDPRVSNAAIEAELRKRMKAAEINSLETIEITRSGR